jgi:replicative DNA helicase
VLTEERSYSLSESAEALLAKAGDTTPRFETGYSLDEVCGMMGPCELALMWARSGSGKSTWMLNVIRNSQEVPTAVFNMEMVAASQHEWLTAMSCNLPFSERELNNAMADEDHPLREQAIAAVRSLDRRYPYLTFESPESPTVSDLARSIDIIGDVWGVIPQRVFIDHLGWMAGAKDYEGVIRTTRDLQTLAKNFGIAIIVVQQTTRGGDEFGRNNGHVPVTMSSGVYGGEDAADWIFGMYRPERDPKFHKLHNGYLEPSKYEKLVLEYEAVRGITKLQVIKNRRFGVIHEEGISLRYDQHSRRLIEENV